MEDADIPDVPEGLPGDPDDHDHRPSGGLASAAMLMVALTFGSALIGMVRTVLFAWRFGTEGPPNAFLQASRLPDLIYFLIAGGSLRAGFVPVFADMWAKGRRTEAWRTFSALFWAMFLLGGVVVVAGMTFSPQLAVIVGPGWVHEHPELLPLCARLMRCMFPAQLFFVLGGLLMGTLNARHHFLWPGMGPILYNLFPIAAIAAVGGVPIPDGLWFVAFTVPIGAFVGNVLIQIPPLQRVGAKLSVRLDLSDEGLRRTLALAAPVVFGLAVAELNYTVTSILATIAEPSHGPSTLQYASLLWRAPTRIIGAGISIALFTSLAYHFAENDEEGFKKDLLFATRTTLFLAIPVTILLMILRHSVVALLYRHGQVAHEAADHISATLLMYCLGIIPLNIYYLVARAFYARHDAATPVKIGICGFCICAGTGWLLMHPLGVPGLALATAIGMTANTVILWIVLSKRMGGIHTVEILVMLKRLILPCVGLAAVCAAGAYLTSFAAYDTMKGHVLALALGGVVGGGAFLGLAVWQRSEEVQMAFRAVLRRRNRASGGDTPPDGPPQGG